MDGGVLAPAPVRRAVAHPAAFCFEFSAGALYAPCPEDVVSDKYRGLSILELQTVRSHAVQHRMPAEGPPQADLDCCHNTMSLPAASSLPAARSSRRLMLNTPDCWMLWQAQRQA